MHEPKEKMREEREKEKERRERREGEKERGVGKRVIGKGKGRKMGESQRKVKHFLVPTSCRTALFSVVWKGPLRPPTPREKNLKRRTKNKMAVNFQHNCWETQRT